MCNAKIEKEVEAYLRKPYLRVFTPEEDGGFSAEILEFKGCYSQGETIEDANKNLEEAAKSWLTACIAQGIPIPPRRKE